MKYLLLLILPLLPFHEGGSYKSKDDVVTGIAPGVFYAEARLTSKAKKGALVMFNMAHIYTIEDLGKGQCVVTISQGSKPREFFVKGEFDDMMKDIRQTYQQN